MPMELSVQPGRAPGGHAHLVERRPGEAASDFEQALALASLERGLQAEALRGLGVALRDLGRHAEAAERFSQATDAARMSGDLGLEAQVASSIGTLHRFRGEHDLQVLAERSDE